MRIAFYGSSLLSSYWNGAATYYRGMLQALAAHGYRTVFYEPDAFGRQSHRDIEPPAWADVIVYPATIDGVRAVTTEAAAADIVIKASGVGVYDDEILEGAFRSTRRGALRIFWDVDAPATLATLRQQPGSILKRMLPQINVVLTYGGGPPVIEAYRSLGAVHCVPIYNALDPATHFPVQTDTAFKADLSFLANRLPDREARVESFFLAAARQTPQAAFLLGGSGWHDKSMPANIRYIGHVPTGKHNSLNSSALAILNVARDSMAATGFSPATRVFEAAGAAGCLITDAWEGIELFLKPDEEVLVARDGQDVSSHLLSLTPQRAQAIGRAALRRCLADHTYTQRAAELHNILLGLCKKLRETALD